MAFHCPSQPVDCSVEPDLSTLAGKTAVITGGATGIGAACVRALDAAGVTVFIGDVNITEGQKLAQELPNTNFIQCNVQSWEDQLNLFSTAARISPTGKIHFVIPNAGIAPRDDVFAFDGMNQPPSKPQLTAIDINLTAVLYTVKLANHYFIKQNGIEQSPSQEDTCLVLISSCTAVFDLPRNPVYSSTKWAQRGIMHSLRRTSHLYGNRVNTIYPWYIRTPIVPKEAWDHVQSKGVEFAELEDAARCLLRILSDRSINGRSLFVTAKKWAPQGYMDLDLEGYGSALLEAIQADQMKGAPPELGLFPGLNVMG